MGPFPFDATSEDRASQATEPCHLHAAIDALARSLRDSPMDTNATEVNEDDCCSGSAPN